MVTEDENKIKIGLLSLAHMHAYSYATELKGRNDVKIVGVWDADEARGADAANTYETRLYPQLDQLLASGLDGVVIATENVYHRKLVEASADAGVRVILCEKPLATTVSDASAMVAHCSERGSTLLTAFPCRHSPPFQRLLEQVRAGAIGEIIAIRGTNRGSMPGGWFINKDLSGGGAMIDHTPHVVDLIWLLLGKDATSVYAESGNGFYQQGFDDTGFLTITYPDGVFATLDSSWSRLKTFPTWGDVTLQVVGTGGVLDLDLLGQSLQHYDETSGHVSWNYWGSGIDGGLIDDFINVCRGEEAKTIASGLDGLRAVAVASGAYEASRSGEPFVLARR